MTEYHYDGGRLTHTTTTWEPRWLDEDLAWAKAWMHYQANKCPGCGWQLVESTAMHNGEPAHSFHVPDPLRCHVCDARKKAQEAHEKKGAVVRPEAQVWVVEQVD
ncbi:hypothetical protein [Nonomuraea typhae]|uniref:hypothetical protein n=1 Tax=Nonomuraea typhae TaxID=2603600 RepID=UPI0012F78A81|nr:hypothetical protein [Nonomuraea typhae]